MGLQKIHVLILEDDPFLCRLFKRVLLTHSQLEAEIHQAWTPLVAREYLRHNQYDVFICDIRLGSELAIDLLIDEELLLQQTDVYVVSAWSRFEFAASLLNIKKFLIKPVTNGMLADIIQPFQDPSYSSPRYQRHQ